MPPTVGWSLDCLQDWGQFTKIAILSMLMLCLEWWTFEIGGFLAGVISEVELGAQSIVHQMVIIVYMGILMQFISDVIMTASCFYSYSALVCINSYMKFPNYSLISKPC